MNKFTTFLGSRLGKRLFNMAYSWGACLVILGATFKIAHYPYDDLFLTVGMVTEIIIFFISGFDEPSREYKWNRVFPQLDAKAADPQAAGDVVNKMMAEISETLSKINSSYAEQLEVLRRQLDSIKHSEVQHEEMTEKVKAIDAQYRRIMEAMNIKGGK